jgi:hypothetical protein
MKIQKQLQTIGFCAFIVLFFSNCKSYGPATIGNPSAHITRPWYDGETVSSINLCGRAATGNTYDINEKNRFGEGSLSYSRVSEGGHLAVNAGGYLGSYYTKNTTNTPFRYSGSIVRGEVGFRASPLRHFFDRRIISTPKTESTFGFSYAWTTEYGDYYRLREIPRDTSLNRLNQSSHHLHSFVIFREFREQLNDTDIVGFRTQCGLGYESSELSNLQMNVTLHYTHKMLTVYGQFGASLDGHINRIVPTVGLGLNYCLWIK